VGELPKREKSKVGKMLDVISDFERVQCERGPIISQHVIADVLGVSRQCVNQWVNQGRLESVQIGETRFVFIASFREFAKRQRVVGRPPKSKLQETVRGVVQQGRGLADAVTGEE